jgi:hypothetical protein
MKDRAFAWTAIAFFAAALLLPALGMLAGFATWDRDSATLVLSEQYNLKVALAAAVGLFVVCFGLGILFALRVEKPAWIEILLPFAATMGYSVFNFIPLPVDDAVVALGGALTSYAMAARRFGSLSRWTMAPTIAAALYTLAGEFVPGPIDEAAVGLVAAIASAVIAEVSSRRAAKEAETTGETGAPESLEAKAPEAHVE